ncbi:nucleoid occlusion protein [Peptacetobacter hominis]|uniref:Nucleoid occlusion protein n=1 Tax=Peptacetobacter hominis TaxID=2743610 RepID=A0A544QV52_9FIRM|nr:nucleoid occlusion protein [Peptacetobacter hominis]TQQ84571.1 nucleoid occlusion protein [Peptacetobacter hominis]
MEDRKVIEVPVEKIIPNPYQPRMHFSDELLNELSESIKMHGVIQPIMVREKGDLYEIVAGERRFRASKLAGLKTVPVIVNNNIDDNASAVLALLENLQREDLDYMEEAVGYRNLLREHGFTQQQLAEKLGKSQSTIANKIRLLKLPEEVRKSAVEKGLTERHTRALLKLPNEELMFEVIDKVAKNELTVKRTETLIKEIVSGMENPKKPEKKRNIKAMIDMRIYLNTIKQAYDMIQNTGIDAKYKEVEKDDYVEVTVRIPKRK